MINEELIGAYLEGNLSDQENAYVESEIALDPDLQDLVDDVYAYDDEPAPYELDLDDIDLPVVDAETAGDDYAEVEIDDDPAICDWVDDDLSTDITTEDIDDGFEFVDDPIM